MAARAPSYPPLPERHPEVTRHLDAAARHRHYAESLVAAIEEKVHEYAGLRAVPLDVASRAARSVQALHVATLLHIGSVPDDQLEDGER